MTEKVFKCIKKKKDAFSSSYLHDSVCRVLNEKVEDAAVVKVSWSWLPVRDWTVTSRTLDFFFCLTTRMIYRRQLSSKKWIQKCTKNQWGRKLNRLLEQTVTQTVGGASSHLWMGGETKVHSLRRSFCLSTDTLLEAYTSTQSLLVELRLEAESRQSWLFPKPSTRGVRNSTCSDPLEGKKE